MRIGRLALVVVLIGTVLGVTACTHKLVGHGGEATISVFNNRKDFDNLMSMKSRGGAAGMVGGLGESIMAKKVPENSRVKILASDSEGYEIQVLDGPNAGVRGYVAKDNVD